MLRKAGEIFAEFNDEFREGRLLLTVASLLVPVVTELFINPMFRGM